MLIPFLQRIDLIDVTVNEITFQSIIETRIGDFQRLAGFSYGFFQIYGREILFNDFRGGICLTKKDFHNINRPFC